MKITRIIISLNLLGLAALSLMEIIRPGAVSGAVDIGWVLLIAAILTVIALKISRIDQPPTAT